MKNTKRFSVRVFSVIIKVGLLLLSLLGAVKMIFFGLKVDEEYAVIMSYRNVLGDRLILDMWEPHQTSGFICTLLIQLYLWLFQTTEYLVIGLRIMGVCLQLAVCMFLYGTLKKYTSKDVAFWAGVMCFSLLPKWIQIPEFSNILLWSTLCTMMCLLRFAKVEKGRHGWLIVAAIFYCMSVLAYPTCLLVVPIYLYGIGSCYPQKAKCYMATFFGGCAVIGIGYLWYILPPQSMLEQFSIGLRETMSDGQHDAGMGERLLVYAREVWSLVPDILLILILSGVLYVFLSRFLLRKREPDKKVLAVLSLIIIAHLHQFLIWNAGSEFINEPLLFFEAAFLPALLFRKDNQELVRFCVWPTIGIVIAVLLLTNTTVSVTGANLLPGILAGGVMMWEYIKEKQLSQRYRYLTVAVGILMIGLLLFEKGYLMCEDEGRLGNIFYVKQKALEGPAKGIYCRYMDGHTYNALTLMVKNHVSEEDVVLYVGGHSLRYMLSPAQISTPSTISTPTYDEKLLRYWDIYPERYPTIIIAEYKLGYLDDLRKIMPLGEAVASSDELVLFKVKAQE